jgi:hypothetical protein
MRNLLVEFEGNPENEMKSSDESVSWCCPVWRGSDNTSFVSKDNSNFDGGLTRDYAS